MKLNNNDKELINLASDIARKNLQAQPNKSSVIASVVKAKNGKIYKGVNIYTSHSICAEQVAVGQALTCGESELDTIVTVRLESQTNECNVISPCGVCRYTFDKLNLNDLNVIVSDVKKGTVLKVKAEELLPYPYVRNE